MTQCFEFYVNNEITKEDCDIVIDWGDGSEPLSVNTAVPIDENTYELNKDGKYILAGNSGLVCYNIDRNFVVCVHTYAKPNKYKVTITGNSYYMIRGSDDTLTKDWTGLTIDFEDIYSPDKIYNQICLGLYNKIGHVCPINKNVINISSCFKASKKLLLINTQNIFSRLENV
jgi:hypothetical protein